MHPSSANRSANTVLVQELLTPDELAKLRQEFPQYRFVLPTLAGDIESSLPAPEEIVVLFSRQLLPEELKKMPQLRWIHCPDPQLTELPLEALNEASQILLSNTRGENLAQVREYAMGATIAAAKQLFYWQSLKESKEGLWKLHPPYPALSLKGCTFLQIGLGRTGSVIADGAKTLGMRVWGCERHASFHPHCKSVYPLSELNSLLPAADVVSLCMPEGQIPPGSLGKDELELLKDGAILLIIGTGGLIDEEVIAEQAPRLRAVILDTFSQSPLPKASPLWELRNVIITPSVAKHPLTDQRLAYRTFRHNLRQFAHRNVMDMWNIVERPFDQIPG